MPVLGHSWVIIRADASLSSGSGHIMRTLALAQAWQDLGGKVAYLIRDCPSLLCERLVDEGVDVFRMEGVASECITDAKQLSELAMELAASAVIVDVYGYGPEFFDVIAAARLRTLIIDDGGLRQLEGGHMILNQNKSASRSLYERQSSQ